jgi:quercetin dioxygenase-like cupin family protein
LTAIRESQIVTAANTHQTFGKQLMQLTKIPFGITDWAKIPSERKNGETGWADWKVCQFGDVRVRMLQYSPGYKADHWCLKGHILFCLEGELFTELKDGRKFVLLPGMSYHVADGAEPHRSYTKDGARLFVVD